MKLTEAERKQIEAKVLEVERATSGEVMPVILDESDRYPEANWRLAVVTSLFACLAIYQLHFANGLDPHWFLWIQPPALLIGYLLGNVRWLRRLFIPQWRIDEEVRQRAIQIFHEEGLQNTRERTGILILVSLLEHRVEILADSGICAKVSPEAWNAIVGRLTRRISDDELVDGLCKAVEDCGAILRGHLPPKADDQDELKNLVAQ